MSTRADSCVSPHGVLRREFTLASTFSLAFAFISPIVALYGIFALGVSSLGGGFWWGIPIALCGQILVALALGQLAARWPLQGGIYQWSRKLIGPCYGWFAGWFYMWTLVIAMAAVSYAGAVFLAELMGLAPSPSNCIALAALILGLTTLGNIRGRTAVKRVVAMCIWAEIIGSVGIGIVLLVEYRINSVDILFTALRNAPASPATGFFSSSLVVATALAGWTFIGFESASSISEEVENPQRAVPLAMVMSLFFVAAIVMFSSFAILLAMPVEAFSAADPVLATLSAVFAPSIVKALLALFVIAFFASALSIQAAVSRNIWAFAREQDLPCSKTLSHLSAAEGLPRNAILLTACIAVLILMMSSTNIYTWLVNFTASGFFISFLFPIMAATVSLLRGRRESGSWRAKVVLFLAFAWLMFENINLLWPRGTAGGLEDCITILVFVGIGVLGVTTRYGLRLRPRAFDLQKRSLIKNKV